MQSAVAFRPAQKVAGARCNGASRRTRVLVHASLSQQEHKVPLQQRVVPALLAAVITAGSGFTVMDAFHPAAARADTEEESDEFLSPYERRRKEMEKRRQLLQEAREKAQARASGEAAPQTPAAPAADSSSSSSSSSGFSSIQAAAERLKKESAKAYENAASKALTAPAPAPEPSEPVNPFGGFKFSLPAAPPAPEPAAPAPAAAAAKPAAPAASSSAGTEDLFKELAKYAETPVKPATPAPAPAPAPAAPKPAFTPAPAPKPVVKEAPKQAAKEAPKQSGKRRGPLPMWFAQVLVLGVFGGLGLAATKYSREAGELLKAGGAKVAEAYKAVEKLTSKQA